jgi:hypothetical protein
MGDAQTAVHVRIGNFSIGTCTDVKKFLFEKKLKKNRTLKTYPIRRHANSGTCPDWPMLKNFNCLSRHVVVLLYIGGGVSVHGVCIGRRLGADCC